MKEYFRKVYKKGSNDFFILIKKNIKDNKKMFIITANPETFVMGKNDEEFNNIIKDDNTIIVADGMGVSKGAKILGYGNISKITGVDISTKLLEYCNELSKSMYFYGAKEEVLEALKKVVRDKYPNIEIKGSKNGYSKNKERDFDEIAFLKPDVVLVALGMGIQEKLIYHNLDKFQKGIFVGVGGTFDVLSGMKKRAPRFYQKFNIEWLYRIVKEPKRLKRFYNNNIKFMVKVFKNKKKWKNVDD